MNAIKLNEKFKLSSDIWKPSVLAELNGQQGKILKVKGEFIWYDHKNEDKLFLLKEKLKMLFRNKTVEVNTDQMIVVPKGIQYKQVADEELWIFLFEPKNTNHTGDIISELTISNYKKR